MLTFSIRSRWLSTEETAQTKPSGRSSVATLRFTGKTFASCLAAINTRHPFRPSAYFAGFYFRARYE